MHLDLYVNRTFLQYASYHIGNYILMNMAAKQETTVQDSVLTFLNLKLLTCLILLETVTGYLF